MSHHAETHCVSQAIFSRSPTATIVRLLALAFVAVVVILNVSHTYGSSVAALGIFSAAALAALAGLAGALGPIFLHAIWHAGSVGRWIVCLIGGMACLSVCLLVNIGATSTGKGDNTAQREAAIAEHARLVERRKAVADELASLGSPRPVAVVQSEVKAARIPMRIWSRSNECSDISRDDTKAACEPILKLYKERGAAARKAELEPQLVELDAKLANIKVPAEADGQSAQLAWIAKLLGFAVSEPDVRRFTTLTWAVALEIIAALSLSLARIIEDAERRPLRVAPEKADPTTNQPAVQSTPPAATAQPAPVWAHVPSAPSNSHAEAVLLDHIRAAGGRVEASHRALAYALGLPASTASAAIRRLVAAGTLRNAGGVVEMVRPGLRVVG